MAKRKSTQAKGPTLKVIPLGGLDGIGKNMTVIEYGDDMILDDAGLMFPDDNHPGVDLILPDYTYVLENEDKLRGIIITHGHEDHIGALPYLLQDLNPNVPIYSSKLTLGMIAGRLEEHRIKNPNFKEVKSGDRVQLGKLSVEFFSVNHSIPAAMGAQVGVPDKVVWAIDGDGSFQMTNQELATCTINNIPIKVALINNSVLGMVRQWQSLFFGKRYSNTTLNPVEGEQIPNFEMLAQAYGMAARTVRSIDEVDEAIDWAMSINDRPVLIDFRVSKDSMVWPMVAAGVSNDEIRYAKGMAPDWEVED